jgi:hypothetical protein
VSLQLGSKLARKSSRIIEAQLLPTLWEVSPTLWGVGFI